MMRHTREVVIVTSRLKAEIGSLLLGQPQIVPSIDINAARGAHLHERYPVVNKYQKMKL